MAGSTKRDEFGCPVAYGLDVFGDRWTLLIVRDLMFRGLKTFNEFLDAGDGIATNILSDRLKQLEAHGIIIKMRDPDNGRSFIYSLTDKGRDLVPVMMEIVSWSGKYDDRSHARRGLVDQINNDKNSVEKSVRNGS